METIEVRPSTDADTESLWRCFDEVARERRHLARTHAPPIERTRAWLSELRAQGLPHYVAVCQNEVVGWCDVAQTPYESMRHLATLGIGVLKTHRGRGIGQQLMRAVLDSAKKHGIERVELEVFAANTAAIALYEKAGFKREGLKIKGCKIDGRYDDIVVMGLLF